MDPPVRFDRPVVSSPSGGERSALGDNPESQAVIRSPLGTQSEVLMGDVTPSAFQAFIQGM